MSTDGFNMTMRATDFFVDRPLVKQLLKAANAEALPKIGAYLSRRARSMLRRRKRVSGPGEIPSVHSQDDFASLKNILFAVAADANSVLCGPVKLNQRNMVADVGSQTVPQIMEFGGVVSIHEQAYLRSEVWRRRDLRYNPKPYKYKYRVRRASYEPRPFMGPALQAEIDAGTIPRTLSGTVRAA